MNSTQVMMIGRYIAAAFPHQKFDQFTLDVWEEMLADVDYDDAMTAIRELVKGSQFVAPFDIISGVKRIRRDRLERAGDFAPDADPDDVPAWLAALRAGRFSGASGVVAARPVAALMASTVKAVHVA